MIYFHVLFCFSQEQQQLEVRVGEEFRGTCDIVPLLLSLNS